MSTSKVTDSSGYRISQLLQPELLSNDDLKAILKDRCIRIKKMESLSREDLLALVHRVAVPLPQRNTPTEPPFNPFLTTSNTGEAKRLGNCINFGHKKIKLIKSPGTASTCRLVTPVPAKVARTSLKRSEPSTESQSKSSKESETPPAKKNRTKITWP